MSAPQIIELARLFGPIGLFIGYLMWRELRQEKAAEGRARDDRDLARERIDTDKAVATALAVLAARIEGMKS